MPIYEYVCQSCGKKTEVLQRIKERPLKICPHCGGKLKKAISAPAIQFKGSGWYVTDYARGKKEGKKSSGSDSSDSEPKKEKTPEAKPETKKDSKKAP
jgi:putative FmdB family regulatory protein